MKIETGGRCLLGKRKSRGRRKKFTLIEFLMICLVPISLVGQVNTESRRYADGAMSSVLAQGENVNIVFVIDRSGSMLVDDKIGEAKIAASTFVGFLQLGDAIGVVSFHDFASTDFPLQTILSETVKSQAQMAIDSIVATGSTAIGSGIQFGQIELDKGAADSRKAMLLLSDGKENKPPFVADVLPNIPEDTDIFTVGLGFTVDGELLNHIAMTTGGTYNFAPTAAELQQIYVMLKGQIAGQQSLSNVQGTISQGETNLHYVSIDGMTSFATFSIVYHHGDIDLELITPKGKIITPQTAKTAEDIQYLEGATFEYYSVKMPERGLWGLRVLGVVVPVPENYYSTVQVFSDLRIEVFLDKFKYEAGDPILVTAVLKENGLPLSQASVSAEVRFPVDNTSAIQARSNSVMAEEDWPSEDGMPKSSDTNRFEGFMTATVPLYDDGQHFDGAARDGVYANYFTNTVFDGSYIFTVRASGETANSGAYVRESVLSTFVRPSEALAVVSVEPDSANQGDLVDLRISGAHFEAGAELKFSGSGITVQSVSVPSSDQMNATIAIDENAAAGFYDLQISNQNGQQGRGPGLFYVAAIPKQFALLQNYPNPFNPTTIIQYQVSQETDVKLQIFNILGQRVRVLVEARQPAGYQSAVWHADDEHGRPQPAGVYFYRLQTQSFTKTKKMILLR